MRSNKILPSSGEPRKGTYNTHELPECLFETLTSQSTSLPFALRVYLFSIFCLVFFPTFNLQINYHSLILARAHISTTLCTACGTCLKTRRTNVQFLSSICFFRISIFIAARAKPPKTTPPPPPID